MCEIPALRRSVVPGDPVSKKPAIGVALVVVGAAVAWAVSRSGGDERPMASSAAVVRTRVVEWVRASGHVEPSTQVKVSANVTGRLAVLGVREGDQVTKGAILAQIDVGPMQDVLRQRDANLQAARSGVTGEQVHVANLARELKAMRDLRSKDIASTNDLERLTSEHRVAQAALQAAHHRVRQAQAEYDEMRSRVGQAELTAPVTGSIITLAKKQGERIRGSDMDEDVLLVIAPLDAMEVEVEITEQDVVNLEIDSPAIIAMPALQLSAIPGKVAAIASSARIQNPGTAIETTRFRVKLKFDAIPPRLRPGMTAQVSILAREKDGVLAVPFEAVAARSRTVLEAAGVKVPERPPTETTAGVGTDSISIVFVLVDGRAEARIVKTGLAGDRVLEIVEGVAEGDEVLSGPYQLVHQDLWPGAPVRVRPTDAPPPAAQVKR